MNRIQDIARATLKVVRAAGYVSRGRQRNYKTFYRESDKTILDMGAHTFEVAYSVTQRWIDDRAIKRFEISTSTDLAIFKDYLAIQQDIRKTQ